MDLLLTSLIPRARPGHATCCGNRGAHAGPLEPGTRGPRRNPRTKRGHLRANTLHAWRQQQPIDNNIKQTPAQSVSIVNRDASVKTQPGSHHNPRLRGLLRRAA